MKQGIRQEGRWHGRALVLAVVLAGLLLPLDSRVHVPAVLGAASEEQHFAPAPARVVEVHVAPRQAVALGNVLLVLESSELDQAERQARLRLVIRAAQAGTVTAVARGLAPGMWTGMRDRLVHVAVTGAVVAREVVSECDVARLEPGSAGTFVPDDPSQGTLKVSLAAIGTGTSAARELTLLALVNGGHVDATAGPRGELHTTAAMFPVTFAAVRQPSDAGQWPREIRGMVVASGERRSIVRKVAEHVVSVALRETGF